MIARSAQDEDCPARGRSPLTRLPNAAAELGRVAGAELEAAIDTCARRDIEGARDWRDTGTGGRFGRSVLP